MDFFFPLYFPMKRYIITDGDSSSSFYSTVLHLVVLWMVSRLVQVCKLKTHQRWTFSTCFGELKINLIVKYYVASLVLARREYYLLRVAMGKIVRLRISEKYNFEDKRNRKERTYSFFFRSLSLFQIRLHLDERETHAPRFESGLARNDTTSQEDN